MGNFISQLLEIHPLWRDIPLVERVGEGWRSEALIIPPPKGSNLAHPLDIEEAGNEVTIGLDYSHVHIRWPIEVWETGNLWNDAMGVIDAILSERVYSLSGWIGGRLRVGSLREVGASTRLVLPNLESLRFRSWNGTLDKDEVIGNYSSEARKS